MKVCFAQKTKTLYQRFFKPDKKNARQYVPSPYDKNIKFFKDSETLSRVGFDEPVTITDAFCSFIHDKILVNYIEEYKPYSVKDDMQNILKDLFKSEKLKDTRTNGLIGYGFSSYVFDLGENKILKITLGDHFHGRKPQVFDLPIKEQGKISHNSRYHYYIEEKVETGNISDEEVENINNTAEKLDLSLIDIHPYQFGKSKDGKIYLIDPDCARENTPSSVKTKFNIFRRLLKFI